MKAEVETIANQVGNYVHIEVQVTGEKPLRRSDLWQMSKALVPFMQINACATRVNRLDGQTACGQIVVDYPSSDGANTSTHRFSVETRGYFEMNSAVCNGFRQEIQIQRTL